MELQKFHIPIPPPTSLSTRSLWVFPVHQVWALVSCIQPGLVICFTLDNIHVLMLFSWNIPPLPSPTESKILFYISVSLFLFCIASEGCCAFKCRRTQTEKVEPVWEAKDAPRRMWKEYLQATVYIEHREEETQTAAGLQGYLISLNDTENHNKRRCVVLFVS